MRRFGNFLLRKIVLYYPFLIFAGLSLWAVRAILFSHGYIEYGEFVGSTNYFFLWSQFLHAWSGYESLGHSNIGLPLVYGLDISYGSVAPGNLVYWFFFKTALQFLTHAFFFRVLIFFTLMTPMIGMYFFARFWFTHLQSRHITFMATIAGLIYGINPTVSDRVIVGTLRYNVAYGFFPLYLLCVFLAYETKTLRKRILFILLGGLFFSLLFQILGHFIYLAVFPLAVYFLVCVRAKDSMRYIFLSLLTAIIGLLLSIHLWLPAIFFSESYAIIRDPFYLLWAVYFSSQFTTIGKLVSLNGSWYEAKSLLAYMSDAIILGRWIYPVLGILALFTRKSRYSLFLWIIVLFGIIFSMGTQFPFESLYTFLYKHVFLFEPFRDPNKFLVLYTFGLALLVPCGVLFLSTKIKRWQVLGIIVILTVYLNPVFFSGDFGHALVPFSIPTKYQQLKTFLDKQSEQFAVSFYPNDTFINNYDWFPKELNPSNNFNPFLTLFPIDRPIVNSIRLVGLSTNRYLDYLENNLNTSWAIDRLAQMQVKYLIVDKSIPTYKTIARQLDNNASLRKITTINGFLIYENLGYQKKQTSQQNAVYYYGDVNGLATMPSSLHLITLDSSGLSALQQKLSPTIITEDGKTDDLFYSTLHAYRISYYPQVRFTYPDGFVMGGENNRAEVMQGVHFENPEGILASGRGSITKQFPLAKGRYHILISVSNNSLSSHIFAVRSDSQLVKKTISSTKGFHLSWIDMGVVSLTNRPFITIENKENKPLYVDSFIVVSEKTFQQKKGEFQNLIKGMQIDSLANLSHIKSKPVTIYSQTYSPFWNICDKPTVVIDFHAIGSDCLGHVVTPFFAPSHFYTSVLLIGLLFHVLCLGGIIVVILKNQNSNN